MRGKCAGEGRDFEMGSMAHHGIDQPVVSAQIRIFFKYVVNLLI
jgi:hypothetical protein